MKKEMKRENELITRGILKEVLGHELGKTKSGLRAEFRRDIKREVGKVREDMHVMEFRLINRMDQRFSQIDEQLSKMDDILVKHLDTVRGLADQVIGKHNTFEAESSSIHHNYNHLEERVKKVETVVFPQSA